MMALGDDLFSNSRVPREDSINDQHQGDQFTPMVLVDPLKHEGNDVSGSIITDTWGTYTPHVTSKNDSSTETDDSGAIVIDSREILISQESDNNNSAIESFSRHVDGGSTPIIPFKTKEEPRAHPLATADQLKNIPLKGKKK